MLHLRQPSAGRPARLHGGTLAWVLLCTLAAGMRGPAHAARPRYAPGEILVKFRTGVPEARRAALRARLAGEQRIAFAFIRAELLRLRGESIEAALVRARRDPDVEWAEPNWIVEAVGDRVARRARSGDRGSAGREEHGRGAGAAPGRGARIETTPDDPEFGQLWGMRNTGQTGGTPGADIRATLAWNIYRGDPELLVGVIDSGVDYRHPDLAPNIWTNPGEIPGNHQDDDGNGYVDDVHGYDFVNGDGDPFDDHGHGTHVSGTIAAAGDNGIGVVGVSWSCRIVAIKFLNPQGWGTIAGAVSGVQYAIRAGVALTNNSWSGGDSSQALYDAIQAAGAANQLFVAAAGNSASDDDSIPAYPASYGLPCIVAVAATNADDALASFSNWGASSVDLAAPGVEILSCLPGGGYTLMSGTSMATPHVSGCAALVYGRHPGISNLEVKQILLQSAHPVPALAGRCLSGARLDAFATLAEPDSVPPGAVTDLAAAVPGSTTMLLTWTATGDDGGTGRASTYNLRWSRLPIDASNFASATPVEAPDPAPAGAAESLEVSGLDYETTYWFALRAEDEYGTPGPLSNLASGVTLGRPHLAVQPESLSATLQYAESVVHALHVVNQGQGRLDWFAPLPEVLMPGSAGAVAAWRESRSKDAVPAPVRAPALVPLPKGIEDTRRSAPVPAGHGGPDRFGYRWVDSDEPGGPSFDWIEIRDSGTPLAFTRDDQTLRDIPIGFAFPFYGNGFTSCNVTTNGFLSFTYTNNFYLNQPLPNRGASVPGDLVAPFWDDLSFPDSGNAHAYYQSDASRFVLEYANAPHYPGGGAPNTGPYTFEVILYPSGEIRFQYLSMGAPTTSATIGIQDAMRMVGLQVGFNTRYVHDNLLVRVFPLEQWLTVLPPGSGGIAAGDSQSVQVRLSAGTLESGTYEGRIHFVSNDPDSTARVVPVRLRVIGVSDAGPAGGPPADLALEVQNPARGSARFVVTMPERAALDVRVYDVRGALVRQLPRVALDPGRHAISWDGRGRHERHVASGIYFVRARAGERTAIRRLVLL